MKFRIEGHANVVDTAKGVQELLKAAGIKESIKNILAGNVEGVTLVDDDAAAVVPEATPEVAEDTRHLDPDEGDGTNGGKPEDTDDGFMEPESDAAKARRVVAEQDEDAVGAKLPEDSDVEYPEIGSTAVKDEKAFKKYVKKLSDAQVFDWCELEGATWKRCPEQPPIDRMRAVMALKAKHFPHTAPKASSKSKSKYADYKTEDLVQMALDNDITVRDDKGDERILRMYTIMALREAGLLG